MPPSDANVDFEKLPHWMSTANWYNLAYPGQWTKLLNDLFSRGVKRARALHAGGSDRGSCEAPGFVMAPHIAMRSSPLS
jgi:hypothetical protein